MPFTIIIPKQSRYKAGFYDKKDDISPNIGSGTKQQAASLPDIVISQFFESKRSFSLDNSGINMVM
jgi:hypothetical protein